MFFILSHLGMGFLLPPLLCTGGGSVILISGLPPGQELATKTALRAEPYSGRINPNYDLWNILRVGEAVAAH
jgi:hypothetical protein